MRYERNKTDDAILGFQGTPRGMRDHLKLLLSEKPDRSIKMLLGCLYVLSEQLEILDGRCEAIELKLASVLKDTSDRLADFREGRY